MCSHPCHHLFVKQQYKNSAGQPYSAAEAAFSIASQVDYGLRPKSMPRPRPLKTRFSISMYILVLTPLHLLPRPSFFLFIQGQHFLLFFVPAPPEARFCWGLQRAYTAFSNEEGRFAFSLSQRVLFSLSDQQPAHLHFPPLLHSSLCHSQPPVFLFSSCP